MRIFLNESGKCTPLYLWRLHYRENVPVSRGEEMLMNRLKKLRCEVMQNSVMWPIHEHLRVPAYGRRYAVPWTSDGESASRTDLSLFTGDRRLAPVTRSR